MNISRAIYSILSSHAGLTSLVGSRVYPVNAPQQVSLPYVVFDIEANEPINRQTGVACADYIYPEVMIISNTVDENESIAKEVRSALDRVTESTYQGIKIGVSLFDQWIGPRLTDEDDAYISNMSFKIVIHR